MSFSWILIQFAACLSDLYSRLFSSQRNDFSTFGKRHRFLLKPRLIRTRFIILGSFECETYSMNSWMCKTIIQTILIVLFAFTDYNLSTKIIIICRVFFECVCTHRFWTRFGIMKIFSFTAAVI